ncbi:13991_t:CDS:2, partial [Entrophospora sp. SA101]
EKKDDIIAENEGAVAILDIHPVSDGHTLLITKEHFANITEINQESGVPKDGPSAGTALTTAIISALTKKAIGQNIGMTGEISLHGQVSGIGGLREKVNAAHRKGLKKVFAPLGNEKDSEDISSEVKSKVEII